MELNRFIVPLQNSDGPLPIQAVRARALHGVFCKEMGEKFPAWIDKLHQNQGTPTPYTLSPILEGEYFVGLQISCLNKDTAERVIDVWENLALQKKIIRLGSANLKVLKFTWQESKFYSYEQLWDEAPLALGIRLAFETPTRFKVNGQINLLPDPVLLWAHYAKRWTAFSSISLPPEFMVWVQKQVYVQELNLQTCFTYVEGTTPWKGFVGEVAYQGSKDKRNIPESRFPDYICAWQALAAYSEFCGTGRKTNWGMGKTRKTQIFSPITSQQIQQKEIS